MRAAVYIRMSTDDQAGSPERQRAQILPYCERKGYQIVEFYQDLGMRGSDSSRPNFQRMLQDAKKGLFSLIIVDEQSRLSREDPLEYITKVALPLREVNVFVELVADGRRLTWERDDLGGLLMGLIGQHKASNESSTLGRRVATGMAKKAKEGRMFVGRAPYGYRYRRVDGKRVGLEIDAEAPEKAQAVRRIFDAYANRDGSLTSIVAELNELRIPSPQGAEWGKHSIHHILTNPFYAGSYVWGKFPQGKFYRYDGSEVVLAKKDDHGAHRAPQERWVIIPNQHEAIVEPELFDKTQKLLVANRIRKSPSRKKDQLPLSGLLLCSNCGYPMYGTKRRSGGVVEPVYRCGGYMTRGVCGPATVLERDILKQIAKVLQERLLDPTERERLLAEIRRQSEQLEGNDDVVKGLQQKLKALDGKITKAKNNLCLLDPENIPDVQNQIRGWRQDRETAQAELDRLNRRSPTGSVEHFIAKVDRLIEIMAAAEKDLVRPVVREFLERVDLTFEVVKKTKITRYPLRGGVVHLRGCADSDQCGPKGVQRFGPCTSQPQSGHTYIGASDLPGSHTDTGSLRR
ncbi:MAG: hypothetical protein C0467_15970 [Planctomycetaceae bacterium]|nr:hypothetical protein [Planctomycetaceae bacterium]